MGLEPGFQDGPVLVYDEDARTQARRRGPPVRGTIGIVVEAHRRALLKLPEIELLLNELSARPDIRISAKLCAQILKVTLIRLNGKGKQNLNRTSGISRTNRKEGVPLAGRLLT